MDLALPAPSAPRRQIGISTAASMLLHGGLLVAVALMVPRPALVVSAPRPVSVDIVTDADVAALETPAPPPQPIADAPAPLATPPTDAPAPSGAAASNSSAHVATHFFAGAILREPAMRKLRATFDTIAPDEQMVQLCNIEGIEQVRRAEPGLDPDTIVPYAMADMISAGLRITAPGAALRSRRRWYRLNFSCDIAPTRDGVVAYTFSLGPEIPPSDWDAHDLNAADADE